MTGDAPSPVVRARGSDRRARRTLALLAFVCLAPVAASYAIYYFFPRSAELNYGTLLRTAPAPAIEGTASDANFRLVDLRGRWVLLVAATEGCDRACERLLYATRQARTMQGKDRDRIVRVLLLGDGGALPAALLAQQPDLVVVHGARGVDALPGGVKGLVLVDPLGNLVLSYTEDPDIKGLAGDLSRLLRASSIG
jgi:hypothetical protein